MRVSGMSRVADASNANSRHLEKVALSLEQTLDDAFMFALTISLFHRRVCIQKIIFLLTH